MIVCLTKGRKGADELIEGFENDQQPVTANRITGIILHK